MSCPSANYIELYRNLQRLGAIRERALGIDAKQTSWTTRTEIDEIRLRMRFFSQDRDHSSMNTTSIADLGSGLSEIPALIFGEKTVSGAIRLDPIYINTTLASECKWGIPVAADSTANVPFKNEAFDVVTAFDSLCHMGDRKLIMKELVRITKRKGLILFTDSLVISGPITDKEILTRSHYGDYTFVPFGYNEMTISQSGARVLWSWNTSQISADMFKSLQAERLSKSLEISALEGEEVFWSMDRYLGLCRELLERRILTRVIVCATRE